MPGRLICFVCGSPGAETTLRVRQHDREPYFPFLLHHDPPKGARLPSSEGVIDSCIVCYMFLTQQWESYEKSKTPAVKRLYWLKRSDNGSYTGAEMRIQGEYIAQVMGLQYPPGADERGSPDNAVGERDYSSHSNNANDLIFSRSISNSQRNTREYSPRQYNPGKTSALDLSTPKKQVDITDSKNKAEGSNSVCYICGQLCGHLNNTFVNVFYQGNGEPFFPLLERITPCTGADCMTRNGQIRACNQCKNMLYQQWQAFEMSGTPVSHRNFKLPQETDQRKLEIKTEDKYANNESASSYFCYICGSSYITDHVRLLNTLPPKRSSPAGIFFPFVRELKRPANAEPLRSDGTVIVCIKCYSHLSYQWEVQESEGVPVYNRQYSLHFLSEKSSPKSQVPEVQNQAGNSSTERIEPLNIRISSASPMHPNSTSGSNYPQGLLAIASQAETSTQSISRSSSFSGSPVKAHDATESKSVGAEAYISSASRTVPHPLQQVTEIPNRICFLCGEKCIIHKMRHLCSYPARHEAKHTNSQVEPFFPFLANWTPAPGAEALTEDGTVIVCKLCFYSLLRQWTEYEQSPNPADSNRWLRKYHLTNYVCYVCGVENERKFTRTIAVEKFNFLREHKAPKGSLVIDDGKRVAVCKSCAYSLMQQFAEFERMGVPIQLRKFNWMQKTNHNMHDLCNEEESQDNIKEIEGRSHGYRSSADSSRKHRSLSVTDHGESSRWREGLEADHERREGSQRSFDDKDDESSMQGPLGSKPPPLNMMSPAGSKNQRNTATVSPLHHVTSPTNGVNSLGGSAALNASRTSSFAAALRKLANQAKDPPDEGPAKTASSTSPRDTTSRSGPPPLMYTSTTLTSPPVVTIAPTQSHPSLLASDNRPSLERLHSNSSMFESVSGKLDRPHSSASRDDDRASSRDNLSQSARRLTPHSGAVSPMSARDEAPARGFQPYRPGDDLRPPISSSMALDHAAAAAAAAYSYPAAFLPPHAFPHPAFSRFDDPLLLERYRMMQSPYLPYPQGMMPHPSLHPLLAAGGRYPSDLFPPQFPPFSQQSRMSDHRSPSILSERQRMEEEKQRELEREKEREREREREKDREMALQRERQRALEREAEKQRERDRISSRDRDRLPSRDRDRVSSRDDVGKETQESSLSAKFGSIIQGTPKGLGIADRYPRVSSSSTASLSRRDDKKHSKEEYSFSGNHSSHSLHRGGVDDDKRMSLVNPLREGGRGQPPPLVSPRSQGEAPLRSSKNNDSGLFRPFDSHQMINGYESQGRREKGDNSGRSKMDLEDKKSHQERHLMDRKYEKDSSEAALKTASSASAFQAFANHISKMESDAQILSHSGSRDAFNIPLSVYSTPLNVPSYSTSLIQSNLQRGDSNSGTDYTKSSLKESQNCISKLDLEEKRKNESRKSVCCSDSECDYSNEDEDQGKQLLIASGPPLKLDTSPKKIKLLSELGLTTFSNKKDADFEKWRKRRRRMKERSVSPVSVESGPPTPLKTPYRSEELCCEPDYKQKCHFLSQNFHLEPVPHEIKKVHEVIKKACDEEKKRRLNVDLPLTENLSLKTGVKRKLEDDVFSPSQIDLDILPDRKFNYYHRDTSANRLLKSTSSPALDSLEKSKLDSSPMNLKRPSVFGKSFVQEFHDSVLQTTRQREMRRISGDSQKLTDLSPSKSIHMLPWQPMNLDAWPGVDGVMETYQKYHQGEKLERQVLLDRNRKLREENSKLNTAAAQLSQRMEELLKSKRQLEELRCYNQERIDVLKSSIKKLK